jgi:hypothetical protein
MIQTFESKKIEASFFFFLATYSNLDNIESGQILYMSLACLKRF